MAKQFLILCVFLGVIASNSFADERTLVTDNVTATKSIPKIAEAVEGLDLIWTCYTHGRDNERTTKYEAWPEYRFYVGVNEPTQDTTDFNNPNRIRIVVLEFGRYSPSRVRYIWRCRGDSGKQIRDWLMRDETVATEKESLIQLGGKGAGDNSTLFLRGSDQSGFFDPRFFTQLYRIGDAINQSTITTGKVGFALLGKSKDDFAIVWMPTGSSLDSTYFYGPKIKAMSAELAEMSIDQDDSTAKQWFGEFPSWPDSSSHVLAIGKRGYAIQVADRFEVTLNENEKVSTKGPSEGTLMQLNDFWSVGAFTDQNRQDCVSLSVCSSSFWHRWNLFCPTLRRFGPIAEEPIPIDPVLWAIPPMASDSHAPQSGAKP